MSNNVASFTFYALVWNVAVEALIYTSSSRCTSVPTEEVSLPRSEISSPAGLRDMYTPPSSEISSYSDFCVSPDSIEES